MQRGLMVVIFFRGEAPILIPARAMAPPMTTPPRSLGIFDVSNAIAHHQGEVI